MGEGAYLALWHDPSMGSTVARPAGKQDGFDSVLDGKGGDQATGDGDDKSGPAQPDGEEDSDDEGNHTDHVDAHFADQQINHPFMGVRIDA